METENIGTIKQIHYDLRELAAELFTKFLFSHPFLSSKTGDDMNRFSYNSFLWFFLKTFNISFRIDIPNNTLFITFFRSNWVLGYATLSILYFVYCLIGRRFEDNERDVIFI